MSEQQQPQQSCNGHREPIIGVLALQGAFEEHQKCLDAIGCRNIQVRKCIHFINVLVRCTFLKMQLNEVVVLYFFLII